MVAAAAAAAPLHIDRHRHPEGALEEPQIAAFLATIATGSVGASAEQLVPEEAAGIAAVVAAVAAAVAAVAAAVAAVAAVAGGDTMVSMTLVADLTRLGGEEGSSCPARWAERDTRTWSGSEAPTWAAAGSSSALHEPGIVNISSQG